jgi:serine protease Do
VILSIDNVEVNDSKQFAAASAKAEKADKSKPVSVLVRRGEWVNFIVVRPNR